MGFERARGVLAATVVLLTAVAGQAAEQSLASKVYVSLGLGSTYAEPFVSDSNGTVINYDFNPSAATLAAGLDAFNGWRFELEASWQDNAPEVLYFRGSDGELDTRSDDKLRAVSFMLNAYRDFLIGSAFRPYVGAGLGAANLDLRFTEYDPASGYENPLIDDDAWAFAYQVIAGLTVPLGRHLGIGLEYRYWRTPSVELEDLGGQSLDGSQAIHSGWARLGYKPGGYGWSGPRVRASTEVNGFYLAGSVGTAWAPDRDFSGIEGQFDAFDIGPALALAFGYRFGAHWRLTLDANRVKNEMEIYDTRLTETRTKGPVVAKTLALSVGYHFRPERDIDPFVSAGIGTARIDYQIDAAAGRTPLIDDKVTTGVFQWQVGIDFAISNRWTVTTDYRGTLSEKFDLERVDAAPLTTSYLAHAVAIGVRCRL